MKSTRRLMTLAVLVLGIHYMTLWVQPIVRDGSGSGGQSCAEDPQTEMDHNPEY